MEEKHSELKHTVSLPATFQCEPKSPTSIADLEDGGKPAWSFGNMAKAVGSGVNAVGSGFRSGSRRVKTGVFQGSKAMGSGVVLGTKAAGKVTLAASKTVCQAGEKVSTVAVSGVSAIGSSTVQAGKVVTSASVNVMQDTTKWVLEQSSCSLAEDDCHVVLPDETLEDIAQRYNVSCHELIIWNSLRSRQIRPGRTIYLSPSSSALWCPYVESEDGEICGNQTTPQVQLTFPATITIDLESSFGSVSFSPEAVTITPSKESEMTLNVDSFLSLTIASNTDEDMPELISVANLAELTLGEDQRLTTDNANQSTDLPENRVNVTIQLSRTDGIDQSSPQESKNSFELSLWVSSSNMLQEFLQFVDLWYPQDVVVKTGQMPYFGPRTDSIFTLARERLNLRGGSKVLRDQHVDELAQSIPCSLQYTDMTLCFFTERDGYSLNNLYRQVISRQPPYLICIQDNERHIFGVFLTCQLQVSENFMGNGQMFLFELAQDDQSSEGHITCSHWSRSNSFFFKGQIDALVFGADNGKFGIFLDSNLCKGRIQKCGTFSNWPHEERDFEVRNMECWNFSAPSDV